MNNHVHFGQVVSAAAPRLIQFATEFKFLEMIYDLWRFALLTGGGEAKFSRL
jgi:hypothetical protein